MSWAPNIDHHHGDYQDINLWNQNVVYLLHDVVNILHFPETSWTAPFAGCLKTLDRTWLHGVVGAAGALETAGSGGFADGAADIVFKLIWGPKKNFARDYPFPCVGKVLKSVSWLWNHHTNQRNHQKEIEKPSKIRILELSEDRKLGQIRPNQNRSLKN